MKLVINIIYKRKRKENFESNILLQRVKVFLYSLNGIIMSFDYRSITNK